MSLYEQTDRLGSFLIPQKTFQLGMRETQQAHPVEITDLFRNLESTVSMCHSKSKSRENHLLKPKEMKKSGKKRKQSAISPYLNY